MNIDIPQFPAYLRGEYLYNMQPCSSLDRNREAFVEVIVFGACTIPSRAVMFHCMTKRGAQIGRLPITAFCHHDRAPKQGLHQLELWDCFSYNMHAITYSYLRGMLCRVKLRDEKWYDAQYMFTLDWFGNNASEDPGDNGWKCGHVLELQNGNYAIQPNNRIFWLEPSFITDPLKENENPGYKTNTRKWSAETATKWVTEDSDDFFYTSKNIGGKPRKAVPKR